MVCYKHTSNFTCTLAPNCTWYNNKCHDMQPCHGPMPVRFPLQHGNCSDHRVYPLPPTYTPPTPSCSAQLKDHSLPLGIWYSPTDCRSELTKSGLYEQIQKVCSPPGTPVPSADSKKAADLVINSHCK